VREALYQTVQMVCEALYATAEETVQTMEKAVCEVVYETVEETVHTMKEVGCKALYETVEETVCEALYETVTLLPMGWCTWSLKRPVNIIRKSVRRSILFTRESTKQ
jgi:hypothetical protein